MMIVLRHDCVARAFAGSPNDFFSGSESSQVSLRRGTRYSREFRDIVATVQEAGEEEDCVNNYGRIFHHAVPPCVQLALMTEASE